MAPGDFVRIEGNDVTFAKAWRLEQEDWNENIARIDGFTRQNADVGIGEEITIQKGDLSELNRLVLAPPEEASVQFGSDAAEKVAQQIRKRSVSELDIVPVMSSTDHPFMRSPGQAIPLIAAEVGPHKQGFITEKTDVELRKEPISSQPSESREQEKPTEGIEQETEPGVVPDYRCGFTTESLDIAVDEGNVSCCREVWKEGRCIWHADESGKSVEGLLQHRADNADRLDGAVLQGIEVDKALSLSGCSLIHANFEEADLSGADLSGALLQGATFSGAVLERTDLSGANLTNSTLVDISAKEVDFTNADLSNATLIDATLDESNLTGAYLRDADLSMASLENAIIKNTTLEEIGLTGATLTGVDFQGEFLDKADLSGANLVGATLSETGLEGTNLSGATLREAELDKATLRNANLSGVSGRRANLEGADLTDANFHGAKLEHADFSNTSLHDADFRDTQLAAASLEDADAVGGDFRDADLERAVLTQADLFEANLENAKIHGAVLADTRISSETDFGEKCVYDPRDGDKDEMNVKKAEWTYRTVEKLSQVNALPDQARNAYIDRKDTRCWEHWAKTQQNIRNDGILGGLRNGGWRHPLRWVRAKGSSRVMRYGDSPWQVVKFSVFVIALCALVYPIWGIRTADGTVLRYATSASEPVALLGKSTYFSTVTFTTLGYGDVQPVGWAQTFAMLESFIGALLMALLVFVLGRRATW